MTTNSIRNDIYTYFIRNIDLIKELLAVDSLTIEENKIFINSNFNDVQETDLLINDPYIFFDALISSIEQQKKYTIIISNSEIMKTLFLTFINTYLEQNNLEKIEYKVRD